MIAFAAVAIVVLSVAFYLTFLFSWCAGYDAAVRGERHGSQLWRRVSLELVPKDRKAQPQAVPSYSELRSSVEKVSAAMWREAAERSAAADQQNDEPDVSVLKRGA